MADKTLQDVTDSLKAVENAIKNQPKPTDISDSVKAVRDSVKAVDKTIKNQPKPKEPKDITDSVKGVEDSVKAIGETLKTPSESEDVTNSVKGVEDSVKAIGETLLNPPKTAADVERAAEAAQSASVERSIFQGIYDTLNKGFGAATGKDKKSGGLIAGLLGGIGAGLGGIGKAVSSIGKGFGIGLAALGAGIAGFALALGGASMILGLMGTDGSELTAIITNFFDAFTTENAAKMGVIVVVAGLLSALKVSGARMAFMMTGIGAGIAGFAGGILLGSALAGYGLAAMAGLDGTGLANLLNSFFGAMTEESAAGVGLLVTLAGGAAVAHGSQGLFAAITARGNIMAGFSGGTGISDFDQVLKNLDTQGAIEENMLFLNRDLDLDFDDMLGQISAGFSGGVAYGLFENSQDMALNLGFSGFRRGSYDFYKTSWKYLNDASTRGGVAVNNIDGVLIPAGTSTVYDQSLGTNIRRPFLHVRYRASQTEDRRYKNWITGSAGGAYTTSLDAMQVNWLSERCLVTQAANNFVLFQS